MYLLGVEYVLKTVTAGMFEEFYVRLPLVQ